jgi:ABC-type phosphate/phosphonate transport system ATPase subunit
MTIAGRLDMTALAALSGSQDHDEARMRAFHAMDRDAQAAAIKRLAAIGWTENRIARATKLSVEQIRRVLEESPA